MSKYLARIADALEKIAENTQPVIKPPPSGCPECGVKIGTPHTRSCSMVLLD